MITPGPLGSLISPTHYQPAKSEEELKPTERYYLTLQELYVLELAQKIPRASRHDTSRKGCNVILVGNFDCQVPQL